MNDKSELIPLKIAIEEVEVAITRLALMHLSFSKVLIDELGESKGKELVIKSIVEYGCRIGELVKKGGRDLPKFGVHEDVFQNDKGEFIVKGCKLAKVFKQYDELELGSLYCFVDPAKSMASDESQKIIHKTCEACGDDKCTLVIVPTTETDREIFNKRTGELKELNPYLIKKFKK